MVYIITNSNKTRQSPRVSDNPKYREYYKIGKEINRAKQFGYGVKEIEKDFGEDSRKIAEKKISKPEWIKQATEEITHKIVNKVG